MRRQFYLFCVIVLIFNAMLAHLVSSKVLWSLVLFGPIMVLGVIDLFAYRHAIRRNFPFLGRFRYLFEKIRPEINQYFIESNTDGRPFSREQRSVVYQRAKRELDTLPFGTQEDVYEVGYEWVNHSIVPTHVDPETLRIEVGGPACTKPYSASILNISAMSYGSLSPNAIMALNGGARDGNFAHNTGEGGISPYHRKFGGDLIWQLGTGYFGARTLDGHFDPAAFKDKAQDDQVKMVELKLSQGAKPGHGGILPAAKVTREIAEIRGVPIGVDVISPPAHSAFSTPIELLEFIARMRELSGGKLVGFKLCVGKRREFMAICKAMLKTGITPDFISVDGGEGGTGAAPLEFSNRVGSPGVEGLVFVHNCLVGFGVRKDIRIFTSGKVTTAYQILQRMCLGADVLYSDRGMMLALGCIQALRCNTNDCPTGVATQRPDLVGGLHVPTKRERVFQFHQETVETVAHMMGAMGVSHLSELKPWHVMRRISPTETRHYGEIFDYISEGYLIDASDVPPSYRRAWAAASPETFRAVEG